MYTFVSEGETQALIYYTEASTSPCTSVYNKIPVASFLKGLLCKLKMRYKQVSGAAAGPTGGGADYLGRKVAKFMADILFPSFLFAGSITVQFRTR